MFFLPNKHVQEPGLILYLHPAVASAEPTTDQALCISILREEWRVAMRLWYLKKPPVLTRLA